MTDEQMPDPSPDYAYKTIRSIAFSFIAGATIFAFLSIWLNEGGGRIAPDVYDYVWLVIALLLIGSAVSLWRRKVIPLLPRGGVHSVPPETTVMAGVQTGLIIVWVPLELAALAGLELYFLRESYIGLMVGLGVVWIGVLSTRPRRAWFGLR